MSSLLSKLLFLFTKFLNYFTIRRIKFLKNFLPAVIQIFFVANYLLINKVYHEDLEEGFGHQDFFLSNFKIVSSANKVK